MINGTLSLKEAKDKVESAELDEVLKKINDDAPTAGLYNTVLLGTV